MNISRLEPLRDGIFAFAMTLLVLDVKIPTLTLQTHATQKLLYALIALTPKFSSYFISFVVLAVLWIGHHNQMHVIIKTTRPFIWINIIFFFLVTIIPFSAGFLGEYPLEPVSIIFYALNMIGCGIGLFCVWQYAVRKQLVKEAVTTGFVNLVNIRILTPISMYVLAIVFSFSYPLLSILFFIAAIGVNFIPGKLDESLFSKSFEEKIKERL